MKIAAILIIAVVCGGGFFALPNAPFASARAEGASQVTFWSTNFARLGDAGRRTDVAPPESGKLYGRLTGTASYQVKERKLQINWTLYESRKTTSKSRSNRQVLPLEYAPIYLCRWDDRSIFALGIDDRARTLVADILELAFEEFDDEALVLPRLRSQPLQLAGTKTDPDKLPVAAFHAVNSAEMDPSGPRGRDAAPSALLAFPDRLERWCLTYGVRDDVDIGGAESSPTLKTHQDIANMYAIAAKARGQLSSFSQANTSANGIVYVCHWAPCGEPCESKQQVDDPNQRPEDLVMALCDRDRDGWLDYAFNGPIANENWFAAVTTK
jgi:hypothetical protein